MSSKGKEPTNDNCTRELAVRFGNAALDAGRISPWPIWDAGSRAFVTHTVLTKAKKAPLDQPTPLDIPDTDALKNLRELSQKHKPEWEEWLANNGCRFTLKVHFVINGPVTDLYSVERLGESMSGNVIDPATGLPPMLFHGSSSAAWHGITRIGVKNLSGTSGMLHGSAYGSGIYLSDAYAVSNSYGHDGVVGVFEVGDQLAKYDKGQYGTGRVYVIPDASLLRLTYLIVGHIPSGQELTELLRKFGSMRAADRTMANRVSTGRAAETAREFASLALDETGCGTVVIPFVTGTGKHERQRSVGLRIDAHAYPRQAPIIHLITVDDAPFVVESVDTRKALCVDVSGRVTALDNDWAVLNRLYPAIVGVAAYILERV
jgi:hypothetical protein